MTSNGSEVGFLWKRLQMAAAGGNPGYDFDQIDNGKFWGGSKTELVFEW